MVQSGGIMLSDRAKNWLRIGTDLAVVAGILLVIVQLRQNTRAVIAANSTAVTDESLVFFQAGLDNQVTARAVQKSADGEPLSALERSQLARLQYLNFRGFENAFLQYQRGYYAHNEWERYRRIIQRILATDSLARSDVDGMRGWGFTAEFERELDQLRDRK
jgi:hypothetical protein